MKTTLYTLIAGAMALAVAGCDPIEDRDDMPGSLNKQDLVYSVTQDPSNPNSIYLKSSTPGVIPFWDYAVGTSKQASDTVFIPFLGDFWIKYYAYNGGLPTVDSVKLSLPENQEYFSDEAWEALAKRSEGKTWVLNMDHPLAYYGMDYGKGSGDDWSWLPDLKGNEWIMENKDWGNMTFSLKGGYKYSRTMYDADGNPVTTNGTFSFDKSANQITLKGAELLYGGTFYSIVSNWQKMRVFTMTDDELSLGVVRDQSPEGLCYLAFRFKPQE